MSEPIARVARIDLYPIKSLDGIQVSAAVLDERGAFEHDREFALMDEKDVYVNGKRERRIHLIRAAFTDDISQVTLNGPGMAELRAHLTEETARLDEWFSAYFERPVFLRRKSPGGFPDDTDRPGPTIVSRASLDRVGAWMRAGADVTLAPEELSRRFRSNIELADCEAFTEDALLGETLLIGQTTIHAENPCARCVVPTRDSRTGEQLKAFTKTLTDRRKAELPRTVDPGRFDHFFRLAINTKVPTGQAGQQVRVGDEVRTEFEFDFKL